MDSEETIVACKENISAVCSNLRGLISRVEKLKSKAFELSIKSDELCTLNSHKLAAINEHLRMLNKAVMRVQEGIVSCEQNTEMCFSDFLEMVPWRPGGEKMDAVFLDGNAPWSFCLTYPDTTELEAILGMLEEKIKSGALQRFTTLPRIGTFICFSDRKIMCRGVVQNQLSGKRIKVLNIDTNVVKILKLESIYELPEEAARVHAYALQCCITQDESCKIYWNEDLSALFRNTMKEFSKLEISIHHELDVLPPKFMVDVWGFNKSMGVTVSITDWICRRLLPEIMNVCKSPLHDDLINCLSEASLDPYKLSENTPFQILDVPQHDLPWGLRGRESNPERHHHHSDTKPDILASGDLGEEEPKHGSFGKKGRIFSASSECIAPIPVYPQSCGFASGSTMSYYHPVNQAVYYNNPSIHTSIKDSPRSSWTKFYPSDRRANFYESNPLDKNPGEFGKFRNHLSGRGDEKGFLEQEDQISNVEFHREATSPLPREVNTDLEVKLEENDEEIALDLDLGKDEPDVAEYIPNDEFRICQFFAKRGFCWKVGCTKEHITPPINNQWTTEKVSVFKEAFNQLALPEDGEITDLKVNIVLSAHSFYASLPDKYSAIGELDEEEGLETIDSMSALMNSPEKVGHYEFLDVGPSIGEIVLARSSKDRWMRARVLDVNDSATEVLFVDYGSSELITSLKDLRKIQPEFLHLPYQAVLCYLADLYVTDDEMLKEKGHTYLEGLLLGKSVKAKVMRSKPLESSMHVKVWASGGINVNDVMVEKFYCLRLYNETP